MSQVELTTLGKSCEFFNGKAHEKDIDVNGKYIVVNSKFISQEGRVIKRTKEQMFPLYKNDLVMVMSDVPNGKALAKCFIIDKGDTYSLNQRICCIRSKEFDPKYLYYQLNRNEHFLAFNNGENQSNLRKDDILDCPLIKPSMEEQIRMVAELDLAFLNLDKAKSNTERNNANSKELFETYLESTFAELFTSREIKKVSELAKVVGGYSFKSGDFKSSGKYQVLRMGNVRPGIIRENESPVFVDTIDEKVLAKALLLPKDVIITQTGTKKKRDYGFTVIIEKTNYLLNQRIAAIRFSNLYLPKFFLYFSWTNIFKDQYFENETGTVGQGNVGIGAITDASVPFIPIKEQEIIIENIDKIYAETQKLEATYQDKINGLDELKSGVLKRAFENELIEAE
jgi:type I restriction enzyme S subunit